MQARRPDQRPSRARKTKEIPRYLTISLPSQTNPPTRRRFFSSLLVDRVSRYTLLHKTPCLTRLPPKPHDPRPPHTHPNLHQLDGRYPGLCVSKLNPRRLKFRRVATRYDKLAKTFHAIVCIAAIVGYWFYESGV